MAKAEASPDAESFQKLLEEAEGQAADVAAFIKKLKARLSRTRKALQTKPVAAQVSGLLSDLDAFPSAPALPEIPQLCRKLNDGLKRFRERLQKQFPHDLREACEAAGVSFEALPEGFGVGPFFVSVDVAKETASFQFAKTDMGISVPLNASAIAEKAVELRDALLDKPVDYGRFAADLNEAIRVTLARQGQIPKTEWRAPLPLVFREMTYIRMNKSKSRKLKLPDYPLYQFIIELKQFIQSSDNLKSDQPYRLETAVLENTKKAGKSVFLPRDFRRSYGEGTYYQAITLRRV